MSVEILEKIKEQTNRLSPQEKRVLANYLIESTGGAGETDFGLKSDVEAEKRRLRDEWMRSETNREKHGGLYVALDGDELLGTGKNYPEAARAAKDAGVKDAFIDFLPPIGYAGEMGGW